MTELIDLAQLQSTVSNLVAAWGLKVLAALVILVGGWIFAGWARKAVRRSLDRMERIDPTLRPLLAQFVRITILVVTFIAVMDRLGIPATSMITVIGAAGLAIGLALQGTLSNIAAGGMLLGFRPFGIGDLVEIGGDMLVIEEIGLFYTKARTPDGIFTILPNNSISSEKIKNYSRNQKRRIDLVIGIGYDDDLEKAIRVLREILADDSRVLAEPEALVHVGELGDSSVNLLVRPWTATGDWWATKLDLTRRIKLRFDEEGISFPFPQRDVHVFREGEAAG